MPVQERKLQIKPDRIIAYQFFPAASDEHHTTLVLVHGLGSSSAGWTKTLEFLAEKIKLPTIINIDCLGHGLSSRPHDLDQYDFQKLADDVVAVIKHEKATNILLVGHCLGSLICQLIMAKPAIEIKQAVLLNTTSRGTLGTFKLLWLIYPLLRLLSHVLPTWHLVGRYDYHDFTSTPDVSLKRLLYDVAYTSFRSNLVCGLNAMRFQTPATFYQTSTPTLVVTGQKDSIYPSWSGQKLASALPNSRYLQLASANHITPINVPDQLAQILADMISSSSKVQ